MAKDPQTLPLLEVSDQQRQRYQQQAQRCATPYLYKALQLMNQCDINYRQSSNKRLLVELTLIEIAQITQPEEGPAHGRRPRRLKSLFKTLMKQSQPMTTAPQVAAVAQARQNERTTNKTENPETPETSVKAGTSENPETPEASVKAGTSVSPAPTGAPKLKMGSLGMSWNNLRKMASSPKVNIISQNIGLDAKPEDEMQAFTQDDLELQWLAMCNRMPQKLVGIASRMKNMNPVITELPQIEVVVDNELIADELGKICGSVVNTLKLYLHNKDISLTIRIAEVQEQVRILTRREQLEEMERDNPSVVKLCEAFDLELA